MLVTWLCACVLGAQERKLGCTLHRKYIDRKNKVANKIYRLDALLEEDDPIYISSLAHFNSYQ